MTLLVAGEALVDVVTRTDGSVVVRPGGSPLNVAVGLSRLGHEVELLTALGDDPHGQLVRDHLRGVRVLAATLDSTGVADARLDETGAATYRFDIGWDLAGAPSPTATEWLHVGSIGTTLEPGADQVRDLVTSYPGPVSFDPNCRPLLMGEPDLPRVEALVAASTLVKLSDEDAAWLYPGEPPAAVVNRWAESGPQLVVLTQGAAGMLAVSRGQQLLVPVVEAPVVDTVGAGDSVMAALISAALRGLPLQASLALAANVAAITCSRVGADPPTADELGLPPPTGVNV